MYFVTSNTLYGPILLVLSREYPSPFQFTSSKVKEKAYGSLSCFEVVNYLGSSVISQLMGKGLQLNNHSFFNEQVQVELSYQYALVTNLYWNLPSHSKLLIA